MNRKKESKVVRGGIKKKLGRGKRRKKEEREATKMAQSLRGSFAL